MNHPTEADAQQTKASFHVFGSEAYKDFVLSSLATNDIHLEMSKGRMPYPCAFIKEENVGRAWILNEAQEALVCVVEKSEGTEDAFFPWDYKEKEMAVFEVRKGMVSDSLSVFSEFVQFMERFQNTLSTWIGTKVKQVDLKTDIPSGFYGLLEFEFFRQIVDGIKKIEFAIAFNQGTMGHYGFVMAKVIDKEDDSLDFCSIIKL